MTETKTNWVPFDFSRYFLVTSYYELRAPKRLIAICEPCKWEKAGFTFVDWIDQETIGM